MKPIVISVSDTPASRKYRVSILLMLLVVGAYWAEIPVPEAVMLRLIMVEGAYIACQAGIDAVGRYKSRDSK